MASAGMARSTALYTGLEDITTYDSGFEHSVEHWFALKALGESEADEYAPEPVRILRTADVRSLDRRAALRAAC